MNADTPLSAWQQDLLTSFSKQQEAYLAAVIAWRKTVEGASGGSAAPTPPFPQTPTFPTGLDTANPATEAFEANRAFTEAVFKQQQSFFEKLTRALGSDT
jgi:hypothetical protein